MPDIDGSVDRPEGRKVFVERRPDESSDDFTSRAMAMLGWAGDPVADEDQDRSESAEDATD